MKALTRIVLFAVFILLSVCGASEGYIETFVLTPPEPTPEDTIEIWISGLWSDPCYDSAVSSITVSGDTIKVTIDHYSMECVEGCVAALWPFQVIDTIPPVAAGEYKIWFHENLLDVCGSVVERWHSWESYSSLSLLADPCIDCLAGDNNLDGVVSIADVTSTILHIFAGGPAPLCLAAADADQSGAVTIADALAILQYIFTGAELGGCPE